MAESIAGNFVELGRATLGTMIDKLLELHARTFPTPRLSHADGMAVVLCDKHTIQFDRDAGALFYLEAHQQVPPICARIRELEQQIDSNELDATRQERNALQEALLGSQARVAELERQLEAQVQARTQLERQLHEANLTRDVARELAKRAVAAEGALEAERAKSAPDQK